MTWIVRTLSALALVIVVSVCATAPEPPSRRDGTPLEYRPFQPTLPPVSDTLGEPFEATAATGEEWTALWSRLSGADGTTSVVAPPEVDFDRWMVVVVSLGTRPTGGFTVGIERVIDAGAIMQIQAIETVPGPDCMTLQALTRPVAMALVPRLRRRVEFYVERREEPCA